MSHRKQQKEALRREREERERKAREAQQRKRMVGYGAGGLLVVAVAIVLVVALAGGSSSEGGDSKSGNLLPDGGSVPKQKVFQLDAAAKAAGCQLKSAKGSGVATHTSSLSERVHYNTNPPTTGRHYQIPAEDGAYAGTPPQDEQLVHALEHGRVIIWFQPTLPADQRADIKALFDEDSYQMLVVQRRNMPYKIAATAWNRDPQPGGTGRLLVCNQLNENTWDALRAFRDEHRSNGPEAVP
jgi:hypothetical protein